MSAVVDTSVFIDVLRGSEAAGNLLARRRATGPLHSSLVVKAEVLSGIRKAEEPSTRELLSSIEWHDVDEAIVEDAGRLGRQWLPSHNGIDTADLLIAATAQTLDAPLLTRNVKHFPMFPGLLRPY